MIEKLSRRAIYLLIACLSIPTFYIGIIIRERVGFHGNLFVASLVVVIGVPWAFWASRKELRGGVSE